MKKKEEKKKVQIKSLAYAGLLCYHIKVAKITHLFVRDGAKA